MQCLSLSAVTDQQGLCYETSPTQPRRLALSGFTYATICNQDKQSHERRLRWARSCGKRWHRQSDQSRARVYIFTKIKPLRQRDMKRTNTQCVWASSAFVRLEKISCIIKFGLFEAGMESGQKVWLHKFKRLLGATARILRDMCLQLRVPSKFCLGDGLFFSFQLQLCWCLTVWEQEENINRITPLL